MGRGPPGGIVRLPARRRLVKGLPYQFPIDVHVADDGVFLHEFQLLLLGSMALDQLADVLQPIGSVAQRNLTGLVDQRARLAVHLPR